MDLYGELYGTACRRLMQRDVVAAGLPSDRRVALPLLPLGLGGLGYVVYLLATHGDLDGLPVLIAVSLVFVLVGGSVGLRVDEARFVTSRGEWVRRQGWRPMPRTWKGDSSEIAGVRVVKRPGPAFLQRHRRNSTAHWSVEVEFVRSEVPMVGLRIWECACEMIDRETVEGIASELATRLGTRRLASSES